MDVDAVEAFTAVLALGAGVLAVLVVAGRLVRRSVPAIDAVMTAVDDAAVWMAWLVAAGATVGSLYFSEVADFAPCRLCWFQRIAMYPLSAILLIGAIRRDRAVRWYALPFVVTGVAISSYHYLIEWKPSLEGGACGIGPPCSGFYFREFGFVTLAFMALCGFVAIGALLYAPGASTWEPDADVERPAPEPPIEMSSSS